MLITNSGVNDKNKLVHRRYETGKMPQDFTKCIIVTLPKETSTKTNEQYNTK